MGRKEDVVDIVVPELGEVEEVKLVRWLKAVGEEVEAGEAVAEVEADKAVFVIEAPSTGILAEAHVSEGGTTRPGEIIGRVKPG